MEEGGRGEGGEPVVGDGEGGAVGLSLCLLQLHDVLRYTGVGRPVCGDFTEKGDDVGYFEAADGIGDVGEELQWRHHFLECVLVGELDVASVFEVVEEELVEAVLRANGARAVL